MCAKEEKKIFVREEQNYCGIKNKEKLAHAFPHLLRNALL
jgi:hypothetical protein